MSNNNHIDYEELIKQCKKWDPKAQKQLYDLYSRAMYNVSFRIIQDKEIAEDIIQESFVQVFNKLNTFNFKSTLGAWIKRIVINKSINQLHQEKRLSWLSYENETLLDQDLPESNSENEEYQLTVTAIKDAMRKLPAGCRSVFSLRVFENYKHQEIAEILNITTGTSKSQYARAKELIKSSVLKKIAS